MSVSGWRVWIWAPSCHGVHVELRGSPWLFTLVLCFLSFLLFSERYTMVTDLRSLLCLPPVSPREHRHCRHGLLHPALYTLRIQTQALILTQQVLKQWTISPALIWYYENNNFYLYILYLFFWGGEFLREQFDLSYLIAILRNLFHTWYISPWSYYSHILIHVIPLSWFLFFYHTIHTHLHTRTQAHMWTSFKV